MKREILPQAIKEATWEQVARAAAKRYNADPDGVLQTRCRGWNEVAARYNAIRMWWQINEYVSMRQMANDIGIAPQTIYLALGRTKRQIGLRLRMSDHMPKKRVATERQRDVLEIISTNPGATPTEVAEVTHPDGGVVRRLHAGRVIEALKSNGWMGFDNTITREGAEQLRAA